MAKKKKNIGYISNKKGKKRSKIIKNTSKLPKIPSESSSIKKIKKPSLIKIKKPNKSTKITNIAKSTKITNPAKKASKSVYVNTSRIKIGAKITKNYITRLFKSGNLHLINQRGLNVYRNKKGVLKLFSNKQINYFKNPFLSVSSLFKNVDTSILVGSDRESRAYRLFDPLRKRGGELPFPDYSKATSDSQIEKIKAQQKLDILERIKKGIEKGDFNRYYKLDNGIKIRGKDLLGPLLVYQEKNGFKSHFRTIGAFANDIKNITKNLNPERINRVIDENTFLSNDCITPQNRRNLVNKHLINQSLLGRDQQFMFDKNGNKWIRSPKFPENFILIETNGKIENGELQSFTTYENKNAVYKFDENDINTIMKEDEEYRKGTGQGIQKTFNNFLKDLKGGEIFKSECKETIKKWDEFNDENNEMRRLHHFMEKLDGKGEDFETFDDIIRDHTFSKADDYLSNEKEKYLKGNVDAYSRREKFVDKLHKQSNLVSLNRELYDNYSNYFYDNYNRLNKVVNEIDATKITANMIRDASRNIDVSDVSSISYEDAFKIVDKVFKKKW